tara:strand:+ start:2280 stop:2933 length:654 start_codon:yes stop_codon:yes gene_type:complete
MKKQILTIGTAMLFIVGSATFIGCGNSENHEDESHEHAEGEEHVEEGHDHSDGHAHEHAEEGGEHHENTAAFEGEKVKDLSLIIDAYLELKNNLVLDDEAATAEASEKMLAAFNGFDKSSLDESKATEYAEIEETAVENAEHIAKSEIYHQREHFVGLSEDINDLIALVGTNQKLYLDFCPMANNNKGATWISEIEEINNPYMGSKMPTCGKIQQEL